MTQLTIGDLAQTFSLRRQSLILKEQMSRLTQEVSSGRATDLNRHLSGSLLRLTDIEHELQLLVSNRSAAREATIDVGVMQVALERVQTATNGLAATAVNAGMTPGSFKLGSLAVEAEGALGAIIGALNSDSAGRTLFSGNLIDTSPLVSKEVLLSELRSALSGAVGASAVQSAIDSFFDLPGGEFATKIYMGSAVDSSPYQLGEGESVALTVRADNKALRDALKQTALLALIAEESIILSDSERRNIAKSAGEFLLGGQTDLTDLRAKLGSAEARIEQSSSRIAAELTSLEIARNNLVSVDVFASAGELEQVQFQLETLYTITARASRLSLVNFLS